MSILNKDDFKACRDRVNKPTPETHLGTLSEFKKEKCDIRRRKEDLEERIALEKYWELDYD